VKRQNVFADFAGQSISAKPLQKFAHFLFGLDFRQKLFPCRRGCVRVIVHGKATGHKMFAPVSLECSLCQIHNAILNAD